VDVPAAPEIRRRILLSRKAKFGMPILILIPCLALFGVFGETTGRAEAASSSIAEAVIFPSRLHYRQSATMEIRVTNRSAAPIDTVTVAVDPAFLSAFTALRFDPSENSDFSVRLLDVKPAEKRSVFIALSGEKYGRSSGRVVARAAGESTAVQVSTFIFP
jgi:hypothetical protein